MKKLFQILLIFVLFIMGGAVYAQSNMVDVIYCKNGSVVKGIIIEQIPNESIKVQTADGSIFVYKMADVERMAKEQSQNAAYSTNNSGFDNSMYTGFGGNNDLCQKGISDAAQYYDGAGSLSGVTWATTLLLGPAVGLIPPIISTNSSIDDSKCNYPSYELSRNPDYRKCYKDEAERMKNKKAWKSYGAAAGTWLGINVAWVILLVAIAY